MHWILMVLPMAALFGCESSEEAPAADDTSTDEVSTTEVPLILGRPCEDTSLTWENFGEGFMLSHCAGCHSSTLPEGARANATVGVDLERHTLVLNHIQRSYINAADDNTAMPPVNALDPEDRWRFGDWLACGAP